MNSNSLLQWFSLFNLHVLRSNTVFKFQVKVRWYEKLHNWDKALEMYKEKIESAETLDQEACLGQMR